MEVKYEYGRFLDRASLEDRLYLGKIQINLEFHSLIRTFELRSKIGCISEMKINRDLFCISLDLHYLCIQVQPMVVNGPTTVCVPECRVAV